MNFGSSVRKMAANFNIGWKFYKMTGGFKANNSGAILGTLRNKGEPILKEHLNSLSILQNQKENGFFSFPKTDATVKKSIIEPDQSTKVKVELPLRNSKDKALELPLHIEKEICEPTGQAVIIKRASHMLVIRKKKMKKHKQKKYKRKFKIQIETRRVRQKLASEVKFQEYLRGILQATKDFSAEDFVNKKLEEYNWKKPVTKVRGRLAPDWVIKKHLEDEEEKKVFRERIMECVSRKK